MKFMKKGEEKVLVDKVDKHYSSAGPHKGFMCRHYYGACFVYLFALLVTGVALLNSNSVSAAAGTLTISVPDQVSLDILPSASGTFASTSSDIAVRTTYGHGYTLGIAAKTANSNALINANDSSKTIPSITSSISESTFSSNASYNNRWGYSPSKYNSAANTNYLVAPTSTTMATLDKTSAANSTNNTYTIKLGARIDATLATGTYENTFVFTVTANPTPYTISYNQNTTDTVTNMPVPNPQTSETFATTVNISSTVPARDGYLFKGWCTAQVSDGAACTGTTYNPDGGGTSLAWTIDQTAVTNTLNLYAMWEVNAIDMQTMSESDCVTSAPTRVEDVRDGEIYLVQRLADGNCWLLDNLRFDPVTTPLATLVGNTNASATTLGYLKNGGGTTSDQYATAGVSNWTSYSNSAPLINASYKDTTTTSYGSGSGKIGVYYNYCAASAGSYCYGNGAGSGTSSGNATEDLCPAGWRMPAGGSSGEYQALYTAYNSDAASFRNALSTPLSGYFYSSSASNQGDYGDFWSSNRYNDSVMHILSVSNSNVGPTDRYNRYYGLSIRCVKKVPYLQDTSEYDLAIAIPNVGDNINLADKRDEKIYKVSRLADGKVWMLDNLRLDFRGISLEKLKSNTNATDTSLTCLMEGGCSAPYSSGSISSFWQNSYVRPYINTTYMDEIISYSGAGSGKNGVYYNYCAISAGSYCSNDSSNSVTITEDLCPTGWTVPKHRPGNSIDFSDYWNLAYAITGSTGSNGDYSNIGAITTALSLNLPGIYRSGSKDTDYSHYVSTYSSGRYPYSMLVDSSQIMMYHSFSQDSRDSGFPIRCVKKTPYMQDVTKSDLEKLMPNIGDSTILVDERDGRDYSVAKLADNNYWMTKNLNLAGGTTISCDTSDCDSSYSIPTTNGWQSGGKLPASSTISGFDTDNYAYVYNTNNVACNNNSYCYSYYSWDAATLGSGRSISTDNTDAPYSICPKGWRLPNTRTGTDSSSSFRGLMIALGGSNSIESYSGSTIPTGSYISNILTSSPYNFVRGGVDRDGHVVNSGIFGFYWSSTSSSDNSKARDFNFYTNIVDSAYDTERKLGESVRCVFRDN